MFLGFSPERRIPRIAYRLSLIAYRKDTARVIAITSNSRLLTICDWRLADHGSAVPRARRVIPKVNAHTTIQMMTLRRSGWLRAKLTAAGQIIGVRKPYSSPSHAALQWICLMRSRTRVWSFSGTTVTDW